MRSFRRFGVATLVAAVALSMFSGVAHASHEGGLHENQVGVAAGGSVELDPDVAYVTFGVAARRDSASEALDVVAAESQAVIAALRDSGIAREDITTPDVGLRKAYRREGRRRVFVGYRASISIKVETTDVDSVGDVIDAGVDGGATTVRNVSFDVQDRRAAVALALAEAMNFAEAKAQALVEAAGRTLGAVVVIQEGDSRPPRAISYQDVYDAGDGAESAAAGSIRLSPGKLTATAHIYVVFEMI